MDCWQKENLGLLLVNILVKNVQIKKEQLNTLHYHLLKQKSILSFINILEWELPIHKRLEIE